MAIAVGARTIFDLPLLASILIAGFLLLIFTLTQGLAVQRKHHMRLETEIDNLAEEVATARKGWSAWNSRLQVCEERVDLLAEDLGKAEDYEARADIAELSALIKDIVEAMGDVDIRLQNHGRLLTSLPSQRPAEPQVMKRQQILTSLQADAIEDRNVRWQTKLSAVAPCF